MALLQNHIAVVTGAASGIGRAIASGYAREGARVVVLDINATAAAEVAKEIRDAGGNAESFALDVTDRDACVAMARQIGDKIGAVSILVNNAGIARRNGMLGALIGELRAKGITRIDCGCHRDNAGAWRFYERLGFAPLDEERIALLL